MDEIIFPKYDIDNISELLICWKEVNNLKLQAEKEEESIKNKIKIYMKERKFDSYIDRESKINVRISYQKKETYDSKQLQIMLTPAQLAQVIKITTFEKMSIMTLERRKQIQKFIKGGLK